ncbi:MAG: hypothetical protein J6Y94_00835 [Bacteriovoracaceae bacterium]|nr:hypothetical protein [Bacteriovoracaceae bacterium]
MAILVDGTMVRLAPNSSLSLQEIDVGIKENFLYARINYGNVAWLSRNDGLFVPQAKAETDALFLPLKMNEANFILPDQMTTEDNLAFYLDQENLYREVYHRLNKLITANNQWIDRPTYSFLVMPNGVMWGKNLMLEAVVYLGGDSYLKALDFSFYQPPLPAPKGADIAATRLAQPPGEELSPLALAAQEKGNLINQEAEAASDAESVGDDQAEEAESTKNDSTSPPPSSSEEAVTYNPPQHRPQARFYFRKIAAQVPQEIEYNQWYRVDRLSSQLEPQESTQELNFDLLEFPILRIPTIFTARELWLAQRPTKIFTQPLRAEVLAQAPRYRLWGELSRDRLSDAEADDAAEDEAPSLSASGAATPSPAPVPAGKKSPSVVGDDNLQQRLDFLKKYVMRIEMSTLYKLDMYQKQLAREGKQFILDIPGLTKMPKFSDFYQESIRAFGNQANHMALELEQEDRRLNSTQQDWWRNYRIKHHR